MINKTKMRLFWALVAKFGSISDKIDNLFFEERPWMENPTEKVKVIDVNGVARWETQIRPHIVGDRSAERKVLVAELCVIQKKISNVVDDLNGVTAKSHEEVFGEAQRLFGS